MKNGQMSFVVAILMGLFALALPQASYGLLCFACNCSSSCGQECIDGPFIPDCPECNVSTCGAWGTCIETCPPPPCSYTNTINGTSGGDNLHGTSANERINGLDGADTIYGHAGGDVIYGGSGADTIYGGSGDDCMYGEGGSDHLDGETGTSDSADGGAGTDTCNAETETSCEL